MEGVIAGVVDAVVVCWASEVGSSRSGGVGDGNENGIGGRAGEARYCREAGWLFGEEGVGSVAARAGAGAGGDVEGEAGSERGIGRDALR